ncbi:hypothetical protein TWF481_006228 [Arthrobotrys musiformis]|uniref:Uncharacterized protein n=1 Tax=Arthrobotrys musiformis TaxID=47236 RepID=A0AAV9WG50_9PEZI
MSSTYTETMQTEPLATTLLIPGGKHKQWYADSEPYSETPTEVELDHRSQCLDETCHTKESPLDSHSRSLPTQSINPDNSDRDPSRPSNTPPPPLASNEKPLGGQAPRYSLDSAARLRPRESKRKRSKHPRPRNSLKGSERRIKTMKASMPEPPRTLKKKDGCRLNKKTN